MSKEHPDRSFEALTSGHKSPVFLRNMTMLHEICRQTSTSSDKNYTPAAIGRISEKRGGPSLNTLYSTKGRHFRKLIDAWAHWDGVEPKRPSTLPAVTADNEVLRKIDDLVVRSYVGQILAERRALAAEVNTLKRLSNGRPTIDMRPTTPSGAPQLLEATAILLPDESETLQKATDANWLKAQGLQEGVRGELTTKEGKVVLPRGALTGIRKLLGGRATN